MSNESTHLQNNAEKKVRVAADQLQRDASRAIDSLKEGAEDRVHEVTGWAKEQIDSGKERAREVQERAMEMLNEAQGRARHLMHEAEDQLAPVDHWIRATSKDHPFLVVGAAAGLGFLIGSLLSMRRKSDKKD